MGIICPCMYMGHFSMRTHGSYWPEHKQKCLYHVYAWFILCVCTGLKTSYWLIFQLEIWCPSG